MDIPGYDVLQDVGRHGPYVTYRGRRRRDHLPVLLTVLERATAQSPEGAALERQFVLLRGLSVVGVPRACDLIRESGRVCLVLEDAGLVPLAQVIGTGPLEIGRALDIGVRLGHLLGELHRSRITHGAISPLSVFVGRDSDEVSLLHIDMPPGGTGENGAAVTRYTSPEQTGRMNRSVDYRTDFYSLGATLYEMVTGVPPFEPGDPLELIHAHIARTPPAASHLNAAVPEQLSRVIAKLLAKGTEHRYQSARGLTHDLERCLRDWSSSRRIAPFTAGAHDVPDQFLVSQKLYGRDREVAQLLDAFEDSCAGRTRLLLVSGYSGIGKTSLIQELYKPIVRQRGYFIAGKFDQVVRNIPYGAFTQALRSLVAQLLTESEPRLDAWRARFAEALGTSGGVLAEVIPEIQLIIGPQPAPPPLDPAEAKNRFGYTFQRFVMALARPEHPLVVFLDDLQWVDAATVDVLQALLTGAEIRHLLIIGAYRDNEVTEGHLLTWAVNRLENAGARISRLSLGPLARPDLTAFLSDTLRREAPDVTPLAALIQQKTDGNPFFVIQFLKTLEQEGLLTFSADHNGWTYRIDSIAAAGMTDNVVDLMTRRIQRLSPRAQHVLTMAACIGNPFSWTTFRTISRQSAEDAAAGLAEALEAGLVQPAADLPNRSGERVSNALYAFLHDRVQQAAYGLIPESQKKPVHLDVGRLLLGDTDLDTGDERIFAVANHLNIGSALIDEPVERLTLARLNLAAGRKAKGSTAYRSALEYFDRGLDAVDESVWSTEPDLMFALQFEAAECQYLVGAFAAAEASIRLLLERAARPLDRAQVHSLRITLYENQSRWTDAVAAGRDALALFGISFPETTEATQAALELEVEAVQHLLGPRAIASLVDLPEMLDPAMRMVMRTLTTLWAPAYISGNEVLARLISATMVRLSLVHGHTEDSAYGYVTHAITIGPIRGEYRTAYEWGSLALQVNLRFNDLKRRSKIHQQFQAHVNLWCRPFETCMHHAREATRSGLESGDFAYAGYGAATEAWSAFLISTDLARFVREYTPTLAILDKVKMRDFLGAHRLVLNWARALQGETSDPLSLSDENFDEQQFIDTHQRGAPFFLTFLYTARLHLHLLHGNHAAARDAAVAAREVAVTGTIWPVLIDFWGGLALAACARAASADERQAHLVELKATERSLGRLADACPENFRGWWLLLRAEIARLEPGSDASAALYDTAIAYARQTGNLQGEALASDCCARFWLDRGDEGRGVSLLNDAARAYASWGAESIVAGLEVRFPEHLAPRTRDDRASTTKAEPSSPDLATVLRVAHAIAAEIEVSSLLRKVLRLALENAGAARAVFLQERDGALVPEAEALADPDTTIRTPAFQLDDRPGEIAVSLVRYVQRTAQDVVVGNAVADERFAADGYVQRSQMRSLLCMPVAHQGRMRGVLYLENNLATDTFTPARLEVMRVLAAQAAISLENARLYDGMKAEVERRTAAEYALREALTEVEALKNRLEAENVYLQEEIRTQHNFNEIVGNSAGLLEALRKVERVAPTDATVLIVGETGTGKELFARAVHSRSGRSDRPLVKVNCGAIAPGLVESELFGHVKGAFTGAIDKRVGRFELANGGTIFLDEVGELPLDAQVKLLRVLQEQEFEPVGSSRTVRVSVRVIAATNRNLDEAVRDGRFRADLLYRLNVFPIDVPPLRARAADIPLLVGFFSTQLARRLGKPIQGFTARSIDRLRHYAWPGNVRELQNIVERAAILAQGPIMDLAGTFLQEPAVAEEPAHTERPAPAAIPATSLLDVERRHILSVLETTGGVVEGTRGAATILGLHPNTLRSRMKKLGIRWGSIRPS